mgnify:CR=1 FL=1
MPRKKRGKQKPHNNEKEPRGASEIEKATLSISDIIQIIMAILTVFSLIGVVLTLREMQTDRNAAYKPTILMNASDFNISWDSNGEEDWLVSLPDKSNSSYKINADGSITGTVDIPVNIFPNNGLESFTVVNLGVGAAKDIYFEWDQTNLSRLSNYLAECNPSKENFCTFGESAVFSFDKGLVVTDIDSGFRLMYMLPNAVETYTLPLPTAYSILIHEIMKCNSLPEHMYIVLYAEYSDVQNNSIKDAFYITINRTGFKSAEDNSGSAIYQLTPTLLIE